MLDEGAGRPQLHGFAPGALAKRRQHAPLRARERLREQPHADLAVGERAVAVPGEDPVAAGEAVQRGARAAVRGPWHIAHRAPPGQRPRRRQGALEERAVETGVVGDDEVGACDKRVGGLHIDVASAKIVVGESGQCGDERIERAAGVLEVALGLVVQDLGDAPVVDGVGEGEHRDLDGLVALEAQARGLAVDVESAPQRRVAGVGEPCGELQRMQGAGVDGRVAVFVHGFLSSSGGWRGEEGSG